MENLQYNKKMFLITTKYLKEAKHPLYKTNLNENMKNRKENKYALEQDKLPN